MPGTRAGTGQPLTFECWKCRRTTGPCREWRGDDFARCTHKQVRTGRTRNANQHSNAGLRNLTHAHEYVCECGHVGWSRHVDVVRLDLAEVVGA